MAKSKGRLRQDRSRTSQATEGRRGTAESSPAKSSLRPGSEEVAPRLTLVATPIGNLGDISPRTRSALVEADIWIVEDTRISSKLGHVLEVKKPMRVANDHTSDFKLNQILDEIEQGHAAALLTDGGAPGVSDPGSRLADLAHLRGIEVDAIPGPSAPITAIMLSGFYAQRFAFLGFLGRTKGAIKKELAQFVESPYTLVLFESPHRFRALLETSAEVLGFRRYAVCREISKLNQQVFRSSLPNIPSEGEVPSKGEITIVIEGLRRSQQDAEHAKLESE